MRLRFIIKLLGHHMDTSTISNSSTVLLHDVAHVPDYPTRSLCSGGRCGEPGGDDCMVAFSAGLPSSIQLSSLPDPHTICKAMAVPDADSWREAMDQEIETSNLMTSMNSFCVQLACEPYDSDGFCYGLTGSINMPISIHLFIHRYTICCLLPCLFMYHSG